MHLFFALLVLLLARPVLADWTYAPPPMGAVVTYSDGRVSRIERSTGDSIGVVEQANGVTEETDYRTWLLRERLERPGAGGFTFETSAADAILALWPLQRGETLAYTYQAYSGDQLAVTGQVVLSYAGEETLHLDMGDLRAHRLVRDYVYMNALTGEEHRGVQTVWHEARTGLLLQVEWESEGPEGKDSGGYAATRIELP